MSKPRTVIQEEYLPDIKSFASSILGGIAKPEPESDEIPGFSETTGIELFGVYGRTVTLTNTDFGVCITRREHGFDWEITLKETGWITTGGMTYNDPDNPPSWDDIDYISYCEKMVSIIIDHACRVLNTCFDEEE